MNENVRVLAFTDSQQTRFLAVVQDVSYATLVKQPEVDSSRLALLGHSMGSGAVMAASLSDVNRFAATVAVPPTGAV